MVRYEEHASVLIENLEKVDDSSEDLIESARDSLMSVRFIHSKFIGLKPDEVTDAGMMELEGTEESSPKINVKQENVEMVEMKVLKTVLKHPPGKVKRVCLTLLVNRKLI